MNPTIHWWRVTVTPTDASSSVTTYVQADAGYAVVPQIMRAGDIPAGSFVLSVSSVFAPPIRTWP